MPRPVVRHAGLCAGLFLVLLLGSVQRLAAQSGTVQGQITDTAGSPVVGAQVTVANTSLRATSTSSGRYTLRGVPKGERTLQVRAIGFVPASAAVTVAGADVVEQNITLNRSPVELAPIDVVVGSRGKHTAA